MTEPPLPQPSLQRTGDGRFALSGPVVFATVTSLLPTGEQLLAADGEVTVDLGEVTAVDSAALALLVEWLRRATAAGRTLRYTGLPARLQDIARLGGVDKVLGATAAAATG